MHVWDSSTAQQVHTLTSTKISRGSISPDGRYIPFAAGGSLYLRDRIAYTNQTLGGFNFSPGIGLRFSANSRLLAYATTSPNSSGDTNGVSDVYVYDAQAGTNLLVSRSCTWPGAGNGPSESPDISPDGRYVAYRSAATDIVPGDTNGQTDLFLYDCLTGTTTLLSPSLFANATGNNASRTPTFWPNSQGLVFVSMASDLVAQDCNSSSDILAFSILSSGSVPPFYVQLLPADPARAGLWLTWPAVSGRTYRGQFKSAVEQSDWQTLDLSPVIIGTHGYLGVASGGAARSFYRVVGF